MGPAATAEFLHELTRATPASCDQDHLRVLILSDPSVPDRTTSLLAGSDAPLEPIRTGLTTLARWGADLLAVPCNTAHAYIDRFAHELRVPLVHIVTATLDAAQLASPSGAWLTATTGTVATGLYQRAAEARGYRLRSPDDALQAELMAVISLVKAGRIDDAGVAYRSAVERLVEVENLTVLTACTELPLAFDASGLEPERAVSSLTSLAHAVVRTALGGDLRTPAPTTRGHR